MTILRTTILRTIATMAIVQHSITNSGLHNRLHWIELPHYARGKER